MRRGEDRHRATRGATSRRLPDTNVARHDITFNVGTSVTKSDDACRSRPGGGGLQTAIAGGAVARWTTRNAWHHRGRGALGTTGRWLGTRAERRAAQDHLANDGKRRPAPVGDRSSRTNGSP